MLYHWSRQYHRIVTRRARDFARGSWLCIIRVLSHPVVARAFAHRGGFFSICATPQPPPPPPPSEAFCGFNNNTSPSTSTASARPNPSVQWLMSPVGSPNGGVSLPRPACVVVKAVGSQDARSQLLGSVNDAGTKYAGHVGKSKIAMQVLAVGESCCRWLRHIKLQRGME